MVYVGIDVAKHTHYACIADEKLNILTEPFPFANDESGFTRLRAAIGKRSPEDVTVGLEATGVYGENLIAYLMGEGYKVAQINPIETSAARRRKIRKAKTDKIDSRMICKYLATEHCRLLQPKELDMLELRGLCRFRQSLRKSDTRLKTQLVGSLDLCFPEFAGAFSTVHGKGAYAVLKAFPSAALVAKANLKTLTTLLKTASRGRLGRDKALEIRELAKRSVASADCGFQILNTIAQIELTASQLVSVEAKISTTFEALGSVIATVPGIGAINGSMILSEIGDIKRFSNPGQLIAFAGLDPTVSQSGNFQAKTTRMSKRGSGTLRYALVNAAWNVSLNNATFGAYYMEKLTQKHRHYAALGHVAAKLCRVIFKLLKDNVPFDLP
jgi:transposase